jgi:hypothetical protein
MGKPEPEIAPRKATTSGQDKNGKKQIDRVLVAPFLIRLCSPVKERLRVFLGDRRAWSRQDEQHSHGRDDTPG